jgi:hypothetical protein
MRANQLQLNTAKTEALWCSKSRRKHQIQQTSLQVGDALFTTPAAVRNFGIYLDSKLSMKMHVTKTVFQLHQPRNISHSVTRPVLVSLVVSSASSLGQAWLQQRHARGHPRSSAFLTAIPSDCSRTLDPQITPLGASRTVITWSSLLHVCQRIDYAQAVHVYRYLVGTAPQKLACEFHRMADVEGRRHLRPHRQLISSFRVRLLTTGGCAYGSCASVEQFTATRHFIAIVDIVWAASKTELLSHSYCG